MGKWEFEFPEVQFTFYYRQLVYTLEDLKPLKDLFAFNTIYKKVTTDMSLYN